MASEDPVQLHSPPSPTSARPKGILKNSSFHRSPPQHAHTNVSPPPHSPTNNRPDLGGRELSEKEITLQNTMQNAGHRRSSSAARPSGSRRQSSLSGRGGDQNADSEMRLKWDEANLYLTEQEKSATMKIDEPKTPYAKQYDPAEDEEEISMIDADDLMVDELDKARSNKSSGNKSKEDDIPGLSLGEPEEAIPEKAVGDGEPKKRAVHVNGEEHVGLSAEEQEKHKKFEEMRKKHYEMRNVANMLGHPEELDEDDDMNGTAR